MFARIELISKFSQRPAYGRRTKLVNRQRVSILEKTDTQKSNFNFLRLINLGDSHTTNFDQKAIR